MKVLVYITVGTDNGTMVSRAGEMNCNPKRLSSLVGEGIETVGREVMSMLAAVEPTQTSRAGEEL